MFWDWGDPLSRIPERGRCLQNLVTGVWTSFPAPPSWIKESGAGNDVIQDLGWGFEYLMRRRCKMTTLPLTVVMLDDLFSASCAYCVTSGAQEAEMRSSKTARKGRQLAPQPHCGLKYAPYTTWPSLLTHISVTVYVSLHLSEVKDVSKCSYTWRTRLCPVPIRHLTKIWQKCFNDWLFPFSLDCYSKDDNRAKRAAAPPGPNPGRWGPPGMGYLPKDDNRAKRSMQKP